MADIAELAEAYRSANRAWIEAGDREYEARVALDVASFARSRAHEAALAARWALLAALGADEAVEFASGAVRSAESVEREKAAIAKAS